ncbi:hypothetical protein BDV95DRAFT_578617 [Massariosphaeria phaeospora]|uniref:F-box domain-containing protein n=1 Tax=Massariosphaeria phaeospora TaxID=100035 RepID=A0A7C8M6N2_9PLEO|nr:hypothetical protein BDV95DRAFT_578617 [Massariosphaeria phaeospora]
MPGFFDLPRELRDQILDLTLSSPITIPLNSTRKVSNDHVYWHDLRRVFYPTWHAAHRPNALGLLLSNRQLYAETFHLLSKEPPIFVLDLAIVNESWLWLTWRFIPPNSLPLLEKVQINLIPCCTEEERVLQVDWSDQYHLGQQLHNTICSVLKRFLTVGAVGDLTDAEKRRLGREYSSAAREPQHFRNLRVKSLVFNIDTTNYGSGNDELAFNDVPARFIEGMAHLNNHPLYPVSPWAAAQCLTWLASRMDDLLAKGPLKPFNLTKVLYERVGTITFTLDGKVERVIDITDYVCSTSLPVRQSANHVRHPRFSAFRGERRVMRSALGLDSGT